MDHDPQLNEPLRLALGDTRSWVEPSDGLLDWILVETGQRSEPSGPNRPTSVDAPKAGRWTRRERWVAGVAALAVAAAATIATLIVVSDTGPEPPKGLPLAMRGTSLAPQARVAARVVETPAGVVIRMEVDGLPPAAPGTYYEAWMHGSHGMVSLGSFHMHKGRNVAVWGGIEVSDNVQVTVTLEPDDGDATPTDRIYLDGRVDTSARTSAAPQ